MRNKLRFAARSLVRLALAVVILSLLRLGPALSPARSGEVMLYVKGEFSSEGVGVDYGSGSANPVQFTGPNSIAASAGGNVYLVDSANQRIRIFDLKGNALGVIPFRNMESDELPLVTDIAVSSDGTIVFLLDRASGRVWAIDKEGKPLGSISFESMGLGGDDIFEIATDDEKSLYVLNLEKRRVQKFSPQGESIYSIDGIESFAVTGDGRVVAIACEGDSCSRGLYRYSKEGSFEVFLAECKEDSAVYAPSIIGLDSAGSMYLTCFTFERQVFKVFTSRGDPKESFEMIPQKRYIYSTRSECVTPGGIVIQISDDSKGLTLTKYKP